MSTEWRVRHLFGCNATDNKTCNCAQLLAEQPDFSVKPPPVASQLSRIEQGLKDVLEGQGKLLAGINELPQASNLIEMFKALERDLHERLDRQSLENHNRCDSLHQSFLETRRDFQTLEAAVRSGHDGVCKELARLAEKLQPAWWVQDKNGRWPNDRDWVNPFLPTEHEQSKPPKRKKARR